MAAIKYKRIPEISDTQKDRFWGRVAMGGPDECWPWVGNTMRSRYGRVKLSGRTLLAHRVAFFLHYGKDPRLMLVCHRRDNPPCCNPAHLFLGTSADNTRDASAKGRMASGLRHFSKTHPERVARGDRNGSRLHPGSRPRGERQWQAKLVESQVREIRRIKLSLNMSDVSLGKMFGVAAYTIYAIVKRLTWKHVL